MKISSNNNIYIQVIDLLWLNTLNIDMPDIIKRKLFKVSYNLINGSINNTDFIYFDSNEIIKYFNNLDWIIDYNEVKDLSLIELINYSNDIKNKCNNLIKKYNKMNYYDKLINSSIKDEINYLNIKWFGIRDYILFKIGIIKYMLPEDILPKKNKHRRIKKIITKKILKIN